MEKELIRQAKMFVLRDLVANRKIIKPKNPTAETLGKFLFNVDPSRTISIYFPILTTPTHIYYMVGFSSIEDYHYTRGKYKIELTFYTPLVNKTTIEVFTPVPVCPKYNNLIENILKNTHSAAGINLYSFIEEVKAITKKSLEKNSSINISHVRHFPRTRIFFTKTTERKK